MKLIFIRHTETDWNKERRIQGPFDPPINEFGRKQAEKLAKELKQLGVEVIVSSSQRRARDTAEIIAPLLGVREILYDDRLRECSHGAYDGKTIEELVLTLGFDPLEKCPAHGEYDYTSHGGENREDVLSRALAAIREIQNKHNDKNVLVVSHGRTLNTLLAHFGKAPPPLKRGEYRLLNL